MAHKHQRRSLSINPEIIVLALFGLLWGFLYGAIMNLWQWPFIMGPQGQSWAAGLRLSETLQRYLAFYLVTSLVWDAIAAFGNVLLLLAFGAPSLRALRRFQKRFAFSYTPEVGSQPYPASEGSPK
jgi:energy-coupling factor transport system substrate-specific component